MISLLTAEQLKAAEAHTIRKIGISEMLLMEHAALGAVAALTRRFGSALSETKGVIFAGPGNNGGDALAMARLLFMSGVKDFEVVLLGKKRSPACEAQRKMALALGARFSQRPSRREFHWIIDGLFGTGLARPLESEFKEAVAWINSQSDTHYVLSLDIPSGLDANTGKALDEAVRAHETVTFGFFKVGLVTADAADYVGKLTLAPLPISDPGKGVEIFLIEKNDLEIPQRNAASHKGSFGHVAIAAGVCEKEGASQLSAFAALRAGCGLVTLFAESDQLHEIRNRLPVEIMVAPFTPEIIDNKTWVVGPGFGLTSDHWERLQTLLQSNEPLVIDGDALTLIAQNTKAASALLKKRIAPTVMTPHPKEASRLLATTVDAIQSDRISAAKKIVKLFNATCLLKGKGSVVATPEQKQTFIVNRGTPTLAKAGTGDVLSGIVGALLSQGLSAIDAAVTAAYWHGRTAELLTQKKGESFSTLASEVADYLPHAIAESVAP